MGSASKRMKRDEVRGRRRVWSDNEREWDIVIVISNGTDRMVVRVSEGGRGLDVEYSVLTEYVCFLAASTDKQIDLLMYVSLHNLVGRWRDEVCKSLWKLGSV
jgi:hypothetical protein